MISWKLPFHGFSITGVEFLSHPRSNFPVRTSVGTWLSLVEHSLGVRGVGSSNLPVPTMISFPRSLSSGAPCFWREGSSAFSSDKLLSSRIKTYGAGHLSAGHQRRRAQDFSPEPLGP